MTLYLNLTLNDLLIKNLMVISLIFGYTLSITKNPIYSALSLILVLVSTSLLLWFIGAEFLAMMYIIVYLGAVAVLFLFVVMMINVEQIRRPIYQNNYTLLQIITRYVNFNKLTFTNIKKLFEIQSWSFEKIINFFYAVCNFLFFLLFIAIVLIIVCSPLNFYDNLINYEVANNNNLFLKLHSSNYIQNTAQIGELLYVEFGFLFILSSFILLIAMIGTIMLTLKKNITVKKQSISRQVNKNLKNSISLYKIKHTVK